MSTYRLMDGQSGRPGVGSSGTQPPSSPTSYSGNYVAGLVFQVTEGGKYFDGYWWYVPAGGDTNGSVGFALWQAYGDNQATVVPASEVLWAGSFTAGAWNFVPCNPIPLTPGLPYVAQIGFSTTIGFPATQNQFGASQPYASGITNGPLQSYDNTTGPADYFWPEQPYSTAGADAAVTLANSSDQADLLWLDVQVTDQIPSGTPERAWPTLPTPIQSGTSNGGFTLGMQFSLSAQGQLASIWHYSPSGAAALPTRCAIWDVTSQTVVSGTDNTSPAWVTPDGSDATAGVGWIRCDYRSLNIELPADKQYKVAVFNAGGSTWWAYANNVFGTGQLYPSGLTHDILTIPGNGSASPGQGSYNAGTWAYPNAASSNNAAFWIDVEVLPVQASTNRLWPSGGGDTNIDNSPGTNATQFALTEDAKLTGIWVYSTAGCTALPTQCGIFRLSDQALIASNTSPSWSAAAGSGWVRCTFDGSITLQADVEYYVAAYNPGGGSNWITYTHNYWDTGAGLNGLQSGIISAPNNASSAIGQGAYVQTGGSLAYPTSTWMANNYWIDVEVQTPHFRFMDGADGRPGTGPTTAISYSGNFISGINFMPNQGGTWFEGYWHWVAPTGGLTAPQKFALWTFDPSNVARQTLVPGSVVTSGTLSIGWNYVALTSPVPLAVSTQYIAATGINGNFPESDTNGDGTGAADSFGAGGHPDGILNGPILAFSDVGSSSGYAGHNGGASVGNGVFTTGGTDPSVTCPFSIFASSNFWLDIQVTTTAPAGYSGTYRAWPNKYYKDAYTVGDSSVNYIIGTEMRLSESCALNKIWYYSPAGTAQLATRCDVWNEDTQTIVASNMSPAWNSAAGTGWVSCDFTGATLPAGRYRVSIYNDAASPDNWSAEQLYYWNAGAGYQYPGSSIQSSGPTFDGIWSGPIYTPGINNASSATVYIGSGANGNFDQGGTTQGQAVFAVGPPNAYPDTYVKGYGQTYWVDMEVTPGNGSPVTGNTSGVLISLFP